MNNSFLTQVSITASTEPLDPDLTSSWIKAIGSQEKVSELQAELRRAIEFRDGLYWLYADRVRHDGGKSDGLGMPAALPVSNAFALRPNSYLSPVNTAAPIGFSTKLAEVLGMENALPHSRDWGDWLRTELRKPKYCGHTHEIVFYPKLIIGDSHELVARLSAAYPQLTFVYECWDEEFVQIVCNNGSFQTIHHVWRCPGPTIIYVEDGVAFDSPREIDESSQDDGVECGEPSNS